MRTIDRTRIELTSAAVGVIVNVLLNVVLIPRYGIARAAVGTAIGFVVYNTVVVAAIYWITGIHPFSLDNFKPLVVTTVFALGIYSVMADSKIGLVGLVGLGILFGVVVLVSMVLTRSLDENDLELLHRVEDRTGLDVSRFERVLGFE